MEFFQGGVAGIAAELLFATHERDTSRNEVSQMKSLACELAVPPESPSNFFYRETREVMKILMAYRDAIERIVRKISELEAGISWAEVNSIIRRNAAGPISLAAHEREARVA
jgi:hypothetical protein